MEGCFAVRGSCYRDLKGEQLEFLSVKRLVEAKEELD